MAPELVVTLIEQEGEEREEREGGEEREESEGQLKRRFGRKREVRMEREEGIKALKVHT